MTEWAVVDANLLLLLVVGRADSAYIAAHKRLRDYDANGYTRLEELLRQFAGLIVVPQVLAEVSNFARHIKEPARRKVMEAFSGIIEEANELWLPSKPIARIADVRRLGLTDAILLQLCSEEPNDSRFTLVTNDQPLAYRAQSLDYRVIYYSEL